LHEEWFHFLMLEQLRARAEPTINSVRFGSPLRIYLLPAG